jgi:phage repressor protein C with HTH and peptisase S24 domain
MLWIVKPETVSEVGCIHTCQGLELEYVGVILGEDWVIRDGVIVTDPAKRSRQDASIKGYKSLAKKDPAGAERITAEIIKNTYRTLMTRGQRGCFVYSVDAETNAYLKAAAAGVDQRPEIRPEKYQGLELPLVAAIHVKPYVNAVPVYDVQVAAGDFSEPQDAGDADWVELPEGITPKPGFFVTRVVGESMNRRIPNGSWCLFRRATAGSRDGKVVLAKLLDRQDPENGGRFTIKVYKSTKRATDDSWEHVRIVLQPDSTNSAFNPIEFTSNPDDSLQIIAEFVAVL